MILTITDAAIQKAGVVYTLPRPARHWNVLYMMALQGVDDLDAVHGFVCSDGTFVDRVQAARVAYLAGQIEDKSESLVTDDLW